MPRYRTLGQSYADMRRLYEMASIGAVAQGNGNRIQFRDARILERVRLAAEGKDLRAHNRHNTWNRQVSSTE